MTARTSIHAWPIRLLDWAHLHPQETQPGWIMMPWGQKLCARIASVSINDPANPFWEIMPFLNQHQLTADDDEIAQLQQACRVLIDRFVPPLDKTVLGSAWLLPDEVRLKKDNSMPIKPSSRRALTNFFQPLLQHYVTHPHAQDSHDRVGAFWNASLDKLSKSMSQKITASDTKERLMRLDFTPQASTTVSVTWNASGRKKILDPFNFMVDKNHHFAKNVTANNHLKIHYLSHWIDHVLSMPGFLDAWHALPVEHQSKSMADLWKFILVNFSESNSETPQKMFTYQVAFFAKTWDLVSDRAAFVQELERTEVEGIAKNTPALTMFKEVLWALMVERGSAIRSFQTHSERLLNLARLTGEGLFDLSQLPSHDLRVALGPWGAEQSMQAAWEKDAGTPTPIKKARF